MIRFLKTAACAAALALAGQAHAATWLLNYTSTGGSPLAADLTLTASDTANAVGGYDVTGIGGDVDGDAISGLIANPGQPFASLSPDGLFVFDNVLWPLSAPVLSNPGLLFAGVSGNEYNLFSDNASTYELYKAKSGVGYLASSVGTLQIERSDVLIDAVPEPAAWTLMILGIGAVGLMLRRRKPALA